MPTVRLTWADLNSGSLQEDEIRVYRDTAPFTIGSLPAVLATLAANSVTYDDTTVTEGVSYWYAVAMVRGADLQASFTPEVLVAGIAAGTNWRIMINKTAYSEFGAVANTALAEVEMRESFGGADTCTGGTASAVASVSPGTPSNAFDNNTGTIWNPAGTLPFGIQYAHTTSREILEMAITARNDTFTGDGPVEFDIQTNDGTAVTVRTIKTGPWGPGQTRIFAVNTHVSDARKFIRLRPTGVHGGGSARFSCAAVEFRTSAGGANIATGGTAFARDHQNSGTVPASAFDGNLATRYAPFSNGNFPNNYIGYELTSLIADQVMEVALTCTDETFGPDEAPTGFHVEYGFGHEWTNLWTVSSIATWTRAQTRVFTKP